MSFPLSRLLSPKPRLSNTSMWSGEQQWSPPGCDSEKRTLPNFERKPKTISRRQGQKITSPKLQTQQSRGSIFWWFSLTSEMTFVIPHVRGENIFWNYKIPHVREGEFFMQGWNFLWRVAKKTLSKKVIFSSFGPALWRTSRGAREKLKPPKFRTWRSRKWTWKRLCQKNFDDLRTRIFNFLIFVLYIREVKWFWIKSTSLG